MIIDKKGFFRKQHIRTAGKRLRAKLTIARLEKYSKELIKLGADPQGNVTTATFGQTEKAREA